MSIESAIRCDTPGCGLMRQETNHWFVVYCDENGLHVYEWDKCPQKAMREGKHLCGHEHMMRTVSQLTTLDTTNPTRESTHELKPLMDQNGIVVEKKPAIEPIEENVND